MTTQEVVDEFVKELKVAIDAYIKNGIQKEMSNLHEKVKDVLQLPYFASTSRDGQRIQETQPSYKMVVDRFVKKLEIAIDADITSGIMQERALLYKNVQKLTEMKEFSGISQVDLKLNDSAAFVSITVTDQVTKIARPPDTLPIPLHSPYNTHLRARIMGDQTRDQIPVRELTLEDMNQRISALQEQMKQLMEMFAAFKKGETVAVTSLGDLVYPSGFTPTHFQQVHGLYPNVAPPPMNQAAESNQVHRSPGMQPHYYPTAPQFQGQPLVKSGHDRLDSVEVPDLDDPKVQKSLRRESLDLANNSEAKQKWEVLEERLRAVEGVNIYGTLNAADLCLVQDVIIPPKFKVPEFDKYDGTTCPKIHLVMYCRKMVACTSDDKLLIHFFQNSLSGASLRWYMQLERSRICSWKDLAFAFIKRYEYNIRIAPDRMQLQNMKKKTTETFRQYAQRWWEVANQVHPPLSDKETVSTFINTLPSPYHDHMIGNTSTNLDDFVIIGERTESAVKEGRITDNYRSFEED